MKEQLFLSVFLFSFFAVHAQDWSVPGADVRRSGYSPVKLSSINKLPRKWHISLPDEGLMMVIQPVVRGGRFFIGTMKGLVIALNEESGETLWQKRVDGGIHSSLALDGARVFACAADGVVYAFSQGSGEIQWTFDTQGPALKNSPLPHEGILYFAGRDGKFFALDAKSGKVLWTTFLEVPILQSPALDPESMTLYIAGEDLRPRALSAKDGKLIWTGEQMHGYTMDGYYPVALQDGSVAFGTRPFFSSRWKLGEASRVDYDFAKSIWGTAKSDKHPSDNEYLPWPNFRYSEELQKKFMKRLKEEMAKDDYVDRYYKFVRNVFQDDPSRKVLYLYNGQSGKSGPLIPYVYAESNNGTTHPPVQHEDGTVYLMGNSGAYGRISIFKKDALKLDLKNGDLIPLIPPNEKYSGSNLNAMPDEQVSFALSKDVFVVARQFLLQAFDLEKNMLLDEWAHNLHGTKKVTDLLVRRIRGLPFERDKEYVKRGLGVYGGGSGVDSPPVITKDSIFYFSQHEQSAGCVITAYSLNGKAEMKGVPDEGLMPTDEEIKETPRRMWDYDFLMSRKNSLKLDYIKDFALDSLKGTLLNPDNEAGKKLAEGISDDELLKFLSVPEKTKEKVDSTLAKKLNLAVESLLPFDWAPLNFPEGRFPGGGSILLNDPSEPYLTIGMAWRWLDKELQNKAQKALEDFSKQHDPLTLNSLPQDQGRVRELYIGKFTLDPATGKVRTPGLERLYPLWLYAHQSGDWSYLKENKSSILKEIFNHKSKGWEHDGMNAEVSGYIAASRIAKELDWPELDDIKKAYLKSVRKKIELERAYSQGGVYDPNGYIKLRAAPTRWRHLNEDIARINLKYTREIQQRLIDNYIDFHRPAWFLAWTPVIAYNHENCPSTPLHSIAHFSAKAWLDTTPDKDLDHKTDIPWCRGDLYYAQKLAMVLGK